MSEIKFYKLLLEFKSKQNTDKLNILDSISEVIDAKNSFNAASASKKLVVILSLTPKTVSLILRLNDDSGSDRVSVKTINSFVNAIKRSLGFKTRIELSTVKDLDTLQCRTVIDTLYCDGYQYMDSADIDNLFSDIEDKDSTSEPETVNDDLDFETVDIEDAVNKVNCLVGMNSFKKEVQSIIGFVNKARSLGIKNEQNIFPCHYFLSGRNGVDHDEPTKLMKEIFFHLGLIKSRKLLSINVPDCANNYSGISFDDFEEENDSGAIILHNVIGCEDSQEMKKAIESIIDKMEKSKGKKLIMISQHFDDDKMPQFKKFMNVLNKKSVIRHIELDFYNDIELSSIIKDNILSKGGTIAEEAVNKIVEHINNTKFEGAQIKNEIANIVDRAYVSKVFSLIKSEKTKDSLVFDIEDFSLADSSQEPKATIDSTKELINMTGLNEVKKRVSQFTNLLTIRKKKKELGLVDKPICLHTQFVGNPGTGKTTVARILGKIYKELGFLSKGHFVEVSRNDLIGEYIGQTAPKVKRAFDRAKGGILFIDEAYSLAVGSDNDFGNEAVAEMVKLMEDYKDDLVVILAGYPKEMKKMVEMNPGLKDRIGFNIVFPDYSIDELVEIFEKLCVEKSYVLDLDARIKFHEILNEIYKNKKQNFSNARLVRKLFERLEMIQNDRLCESRTFDKDELVRLKLDDVLNLNEDKEIKEIVGPVKASSIGFSLNGGRDAIRA